MPSSSTGARADTAGAVILVVEEMLGEVSGFIQIHQTAVAIVAAEEMAAAAIESHPQHRIKKPPIRVGGSIKLNEPGFALTRNLTSGSCSASRESSGVPDGGQWPDPAFQDRQLHQQQFQGPSRSQKLSR